MPHFHDYGLVKGILHPLFAGIPTYLMPALAFLKRPIRWLAAIERYGITHSGGPNFAYGHCVRLTTPAERMNLNLTSWRVASCGAEPVSKDTMDRFMVSFETRSEEHTSELQSRQYLVCRLLLEKKKTT